MRKSARARHPEEPVVATFMIPYAKWQAFKTVLEAEGSTISATLVAFIEGYLAAQRSPHESSQEINTRLHQILRYKVAHWEQQIATLQHRLLRTEASIEDLNFLLDRVQREQRARPVAVETLDGEEAEGEVLLGQADVTAVQWSDELADLTDGQPERAGLTLVSLCRAFGLNPNSLVSNANLRGVSLEDYLYQLTGWSYRQGRYYPP
jgi:hypothetical protein